jgi:flagellar biogenesis protein FliO
MCRPYIPTKGRTRMVRNAFQLTLIALILAAGSGFAQTPSQPPSQNGESTQQISGDSGALKSSTPPAPDHAEVLPAPPDFSFLKIAGGLGLVLCLIVAGLMGGKRLFPQYFARPVAEKSLKVLETLGMGERRSISLVEFEGQRYMIGNTAQQISLLATLPGRSYLSDELTESSQPFQFSQAKPASNSFKSIYEKERAAPARGTGRPIPPDIRAKMRQLRESLEMPKA